MLPEDVDMANFRYVLMVLKKILTQIVKVIESISIRWSSLCGKHATDEHILLMIVA